MNIQLMNESRGIGMHDVTVLWKALTTKLQRDSIELPTNPIRISKEPIWFTAQLVKDIILITAAERNTPSCSISSPRSIHFADIEKIHPFYLKRKEGIAVSKEVTDLTKNQVYIYGLMHFAESLLKD
jgi:hypothetical protein